MDPYCSSPKLLGDVGCQASHIRGASISSGVTPWVISRTPKPLRNNGGLIQTVILKQVTSDSDSDSPTTNRNTTKKGPPEMGAPFPPGPPWRSSAIAEKNGDVEKSRTSGGQPELK